MPVHESNEAPGPKGGAWFTTTHWSVALERLCRTYWAPLYAYIRREGYSAEDSQDLTQEFLSRFIHKDWAAAFLARMEDNANWPPWIPHKAESPQ